MTPEQMALLAEVVFKRMGPVTAYAYAREGGYDGTEEEFAALMADYAAVEGRAQGYANDASDAAALAYGYKNDAAGSASTATQKATAASNSATAAAGSASTATQKAAAASDSATLAGNSATAASGSASAASGSASAADTSAKTSEAYAVGKRGGTPVGSSDPAYHNNSDFYRQRAEAWAKGTIDGTAVGSGDAAYHANSKFFRDEADQYAEDAEAWAQGTRDGVAVLPDDPTYHKSAAYEAAAAANSAASAASDAADVASALEIAQTQYLKAFPQDVATGAAASFSDGADGIPMLSVKAAINPTQSLHGYDHPWVGGAGSNLLDFDNAILTRATKEGTEDNYTLTVTDSGGAALTYSLPDAYIGKTLYLSGTITRTGAHANDVAVQLQTSASSFPLVASYTDNAVELDDVAVSIPANAEFVRLRIVAAANADTSTGETVTVQNLRLCAEQDQPWTPYENICPITGASSASISGMGKNLARVSGATNYSSSVVSYDAETDVLSVSGSSTYAGARILLTKLSAGVRYVFSAHGKLITGTKWRIALQKGASLLIIAASGAMTASGDVEFSYTPVESDRYYLLLLANLTTEQASEVEFTRIQAEAKASGGASEYEQYVRTTKTEAFGETVYGGDVDFVSGELTETRAMIVADGSAVEAADVDIDAESGLYYATIDISGAPGVPSSGTAKVLSDRFTDGGEVAVGGCYIPPDGDVIVFCIPDQSITTTADMNAWLATNNAQFCYSLTAPVETQLTANEVDSLLGQNTIWSDRGDVSVIYRADIALWVEKKIAAALA